MTRKQLIEAVARATKQPQPVVETVLSSVLDQIEQTVKSGEEVVLRGFGKLERRDLPARTKRNPQTGAKVELNPSSTAVFYASPALKERLGRP